MTYGQSLNTPRNYEVEGTVTTVDIQRGVCKVICDDGRMIGNVLWGQVYGGVGRSAFNYTPVPRERVRVRYDQRGNAYIESSVQPIGFSRSDRIFLGPIQTLDPTYFYTRYNSSMNSSAATAGTSRPIDQIPGDVTITQGGGVLGATNSGSIIAKASSLAQIFITKIDDLVRVVSRNYQQFSEASKTVQENVAGRVYEYKSWYHTKNSSREDAPEYEEIMGDVAAGDYTKGELINPVDLPDQDDIIYKRRVVNNGVMRFQEETTLLGESSFISTDGGGNYSTELRRNTMWSIQVDDGTDTSKMEVTASKALIRSLGSSESSLTLEEDGTIAKENPNGSVILNPDGSSVQTSPGGSISLNADGSSRQQNALGYIELKASGVVEINGTTIDPTGKITTANGASMDSDVLTSSSTSLDGHTHNYEDGAPSPPAIKTTTAPI